MSNKSFSKGGLVAAAITIAILPALSFIYSEAPSSVVTSEVKVQAVCFFGGAAFTLLIRSFDPLTVGCGIATWLGGAILGFTVAVAATMNTQGSGLIAILPVIFVGLLLCGPLLLFGFMFKSKRSPHETK